MLESSRARLPMRSSFLPSQLRGRIAQSSRCGQKTSLMANLKINFACLYRWNARNGSRTLRFFSSSSSSSTCFCCCIITTTTSSVFILFSARYRFGCLVANCDFISFYSFFPFLMQSMSHIPIRTFLYKFGNCADRQIVCVNLAATCWLAKTAPLMSSVAN